MASSRTVEEAIDGFKDSLRGKSERTRETYLTALHHFRDYLDFRKTPAGTVAANSLPGDTLEEFYIWLRKAYGSSSPATLSTHAAGVRSFFRYLYRHNIGPTAASFEQLKDGLHEVMGKSNYKTPRVDRALPLVVMDVNKVPIPEPTATNAIHRLNLLRDRALINTLYCTGMRRQEVASLNRADVDDGYAEQALITGKGQKDRTVFFDEDTLGYLRDYLEARSDSFIPLFIRHDKRRGRPEKNGINYRLSAQSVWLTVKRCARAVGVTATTHHFRHNKASTMLNRGANLSEVQDILGHASPETTKRIYAHYEVSHLREAFDRYSVPASELPKQMETEKRKRKRKEE